ncbi:MAG: PqqD family peptide modification chaperone [Nitrososphaerales archaeon]
MSLQKLTEEQITFVLKNVKDPEIDCNIVDLGLVYGISINNKNDVELRITLTSLGCPLSETLVKDVKKNLGDIQGIGNIDVQIVWDPPWTPDRMTEVGKEKLDLLRSSEALRFAIDYEKTKIIKQGTEVELKDGSIELLNPEKKNYGVNQALFELWSICDGTKTVNELIETFSKKLNRERVDMERDIVTSVQQLLAVGLLRAETPPASTDSDSTQSSS